MDTRVFLAECGDYAKAGEAVRRVFDAFGGAKEVLSGYKKVVVKPNLVMPRAPDTATTTHPAVVEAVCRELREAGAEVRIIDSTGGPHTVTVLKALYSRCGMVEAAQKSGAELCYDVSSRTVPNPGGVMEKEFQILTPIAEAELVISLGKVKTHGISTISGCMKNMFGSIPGLGKPLMHKKYPGRSEFVAMLVDLCRCIAPEFSILDGVVGMEGPGPTGGTPKKLGVIAGAKNVFALDMAQSYLMGFKPDDVLSVAESIRRGLTPSSLDELEWLGDNRVKFRTSFAPAIKGVNSGLLGLAGLFAPRRKRKLELNRAPYPEIKQSCVGCGDCERVCPEKAIEIREKRAVIDTSKCIKCYCCHEFCPVKAIGLGRGH